MKKSILVTLFRLGLCFSCHNVGFWTCSRVIAIAPLFFFFQAVTEKVERKTVTKTRTTQSRTTEFRSVELHSICLPPGTGQVTGTQKETFKLDHIFFPKRSNKLRILVVKSRITRVFFVRVCVCVYKLYQREVLPI